MHSLHQKNNCRPRIVQRAFVSATSATAVVEATHLGQIHSLRTKRIS